MCLEAVLASSACVRILSRDASMCTDVRTVLTENYSPSRRRLTFGVVRRGAERFGQIWDENSRSASASRGLERTA